MLEPTQIVTLVALALVDSTSFGTLLIPIWLLTAPGKIRALPIFVYLGSIAACYFLLGLALLFGATAVFRRFQDAFETPAAYIVQLVLGIALFVTSCFMDTKRARERAALRAERGEGRIFSWRARLTSGAQGTLAFTSLVLLSLTATAVEAASMVPYLGAIGILATTLQTNWLLACLALAAYCLVMIAPALVLLAARAFAARQVEAPLARIERWLSKHAGSTASWVIGILGVLLALHAGSALWPQ